MAPDSSEGLMHTHDYIPHPLYKGWEICSTCKSAHNTVRYPREGYLDNYWSSEKGHSTIEDQRYNLEVFVNEKGESKVNAVLKHVEGNSLLEIGCSPGSLLRAARNSGKFPNFESDLEGIEPDEKYLQPIMDYSGASIIWNGFFEDIDFGKRTYFSIVAMDVLEHVSDPIAFVEKCMSLLDFGGKLILMIPTIECAREQDFHPEHVNIWSETYLREWLNPIVIEKWLDGHCVVVVEK